MKLDYSSAWEKTDVFVGPQLSVVQCCLQKETLSQFADIIILPSYESHPKILKRKKNPTSIVR